jgi:phosphatidate phosphatase APP1
VSNAAPATQPRRSRKWVIEPYLGYGTAAKLVLQGRVLRYTGVITWSESDTKWRNLRNMWKRFATRVVPGARVRARHGANEALAVSDSEGYFTIEIEPGAPVDAGGWHDIELDLIDAPLVPGVSRTTGQVLVPSAAARFGVISDIDDTVVTTHVTSTLQMLVTVLFSNPHVRTPFAGIAAFYRALHDGAGGAAENPIFYVSNGPWNLYGLLVEFFRLNRIPLGPLFLRDFGPRMLLGTGREPSRKLVHIERILGTYPHLPFVLIGDSAERDPEIYAEVVKRFPDRVRAIYIRAVDSRAERLAAIDALAEATRASRTQFVLAPDSAFAAVHAAGESLIEASRLSEIRDEKT